MIPAFQKGWLITSEAIVVGERLVLRIVIGKPAAQVLVPCKEADENPGCAALDWAICLSL